MAPYCDADTSKEGTTYELFSVVIHSGSTHSGHYTAYIKDIDGLGTWTSPVSWVWYTRSLLSLQSPQSEIETNSILVLKLVLYMNLI